MIRPRDHRGQSLVEFALILPIFVLILVGLFDFGAGIYAFNTISQAAARRPPRDRRPDHRPCPGRGREPAVSLGIDPADVVWTSATGTA